MSLVGEMKDFVEKMKAGKAERRQRLGEIRKETAEDLSGFTSARKKMAADLREDLKASTFERQRERKERSDATKTIKEEVSAMRGGFRARQKELKGEIQTMSKVWRGVPETSKKPRKEVYPRER